MTCLNYYSNDDISKALGDYYEFDLKLLPASDIEPQITEITGYENIIARLIDNDDKDRLVSKLNDKERNRLISLNRKTRDKHMKKLESMIVDYRYNMFINDKRNNEAFYPVKKYTGGIECDKCHEYIAVEEFKHVLDIGKCPICGQPVTEAVYEAINEKNKANIEEFNVAMEKALMEGDWGA